MAALLRGARRACGHNSGDDHELWIDGRPFLSTIGPEYPEALTDVVESGLPRLLGWTPRAVVTVAAMCNDAEDHRLLGRLCLALCEATGGIVAFGGALPFGPDVEGLAPSSPLRVTNPGGLAGVLLVASYETVSGALATTHYGDASLLRAWLAQPTFHMIK